MPNLTESIHEMEAALYLDPLMRCVTGSIYDDDLDTMRGSFRKDPQTTRAHTMIGMPRLENLRHCVETVPREGVPGDLVETGAWRGPRRAVRGGARTPLRLATMPRTSIVTPWASRTR